MKVDIKLQFSRFVVISVFLFGAVLAESTDGCRVPADPDILGLGTRLGLYFQVISALLIGISRPEESADSLLPTGLFLASFFGALIYSTVLNEFPPGAIISCTWYPVLIIVVLVPTNFGKPSDPSKTSRRSILGTILFVTSVSLSSWFWFKGLDAVNAQQCMAPRVFLFANLSAYGNVRILFKIFSLALIVALALALGLGFILGARAGRPSKNTGDQQSIALEAMPPTARAKSLTPSVRSIETAMPELSASVPLLESQSPMPASLGSMEHLNVPETSQAPSAVRLITDDAPSTAVGRTVEVVKLESSTSAVSHPEATPPVESSGGERDNMPLIWTLFRSGMFWMVVYIIASELQLKWNHLDGINSVNTTGQIIPLGLGTLSLIRSVWLMKDVSWRQIVHQRHVPQSEVFWETQRRSNAAVIPSRWS